MFPQFRALRLEQIILTYVPYSVDFKLSTMSIRANL